MTRPTSTHSEAYLRWLEEEIVGEERSGQLDAGTFFSAGSCFKGLPRISK